MPSAEPASAPAVIDGLPYAVPAGEAVDLAGRGTTWVRRLAGPPGAPTLLLLHGLTASSALNWFACFGPLTESFSVVAPDLRGHGRGLRAPRRFPLELLADDCAATATVLGLDRVIPVGFSMGGAVAQLLWRRHPDLVGGLVLVSTATRFRMTPVGKRLYGLNALLARTAAVLPPGLRRTLADRAVPVGHPELQRWMIAEAARNSPPGLVRVAQALSRFHSTGWVGAVDVPTAVLVATRDRSLSPKAQRALAEAVPSARAIEVPTVHSGVVWQPDVAVPALVDACRAVAGR